MWKYPDGTFRITPPAKVAYQGYERKFTDLTREQQDELGYNEALPIRREPFIAYATQWVKGTDRIYREEVVSATKDETARGEAEAAAIRAERDRLLAGSDWTHVADCPLSNQDISDWATYRQALRDVPQQAEFPQSVTWPTPPA